MKFSKRIIPLLLLIAVPVLAQVITSPAGRNIMSLPAAMPGQVLTSAGSTNVGWSNSVASGVAPVNGQGSNNIFYLPTLTNPVVQVGLTVIGTNNLTNAMIANQNGQGSNTILYNATLTNPVVQTGLTVIGTNNLTNVTVLNQGGQGSNNILYKPIETNTTVQVGLTVIGTNNLTNVTVLNQNGQGSNNIFFQPIETNTTVQVGLTVIGTNNLTNVTVLNQGGQGSNNILYKPIETNTTVQVGLTVIGTNNLTNVTVLNQNGQGSNNIFYNPLLTNPVVQVGLTVIGTNNLTNGLLAAQAGQASNTVLYLPVLTNPVVQVGLTVVGTNNLTNGMIVSQAGQGSNTILYLPVLTNPVVQVGLTVTGTNSITNALGSAAFAPTNFMIEAQGGQGSNNILSTPTATNAAVYAGGSGALKVHSDSANHDLIDGYDFLGDLNFVLAYNGNITSQGALTVAGATTLNNQVTVSGQFTAAANANIGSLTVVGTNSITNALGSAAFVGTNTFVAALQGQGSNNILFQPTLTNPVVQVGLTVNGTNNITNNLPIGSATVLGAFKVGTGLSVAGDGTLSSTGGGTGSGIAIQNGQGSNTILYLPTLTNPVVQVGLTVSGTNSITNGLGSAAFVPTNFMIEAQGGQGSNNILNTATLTNPVVQGGATVNGNAVVTGLSLLQGTATVTGQFSATANANVGSLTVLGTNSITNALGSAAFAPTNFMVESQGGQGSNNIFFRPNSSNETVYGDSTAIPARAALKVFGDGSGHDILDGFSFGGANEFAFAPNGTLTVQGSMEVPGGGINVGLGIDSLGPIIAGPGADFQGVGDLLSGIPVSGLAQSGATDGQVPTWNGTQWTPETPTGGGGASFTFNPSQFFGGPSTTNIPAGAPMTNLSLWSAYLTNTDLTASNLAVQTKLNVTNLVSTNAGTQKVNINFPNGTATFAGNVTTSGQFNGSGAGLSGTPLSALAQSGASSGQIATWNGSGWTAQTSSASPTYYASASLNNPLTITYPTTNSAGQVVFSNAPTASDSAIIVGSGSSLGVPVSTGYSDQILGGHGNSIANPSVGQVIDGVLIGGQTNILAVNVNSVGGALQGAGIFAGIKNQINSGNDGNGGLGNTIVGGTNNLITGNSYYSSITGGAGNTINETANFTRPSASIIGGISNSASDSLQGMDGGVIVGGSNNMLTDTKFAVILGGVGNTNNGSGGTGSAMAGGSFNYLDAWNSAQLGGELNLNSSWNSVIAGGQSNAIGNLLVGGSIVDTPSNCVILGGTSNYIGTNKFSGPIYTGAANSVVGGVRANVTNSQCFMWSDGTAPMRTTADNQFWVQASGGANFIGQLNINGVGVLTSGSQVETHSALGLTNNNSAPATYNLGANGTLYVSNVFASNLTGGNTNILDPVQNFGADPSDTVDSYLAFSNCFYTAMRQRATVIIPPGIYTNSSYFVITNPITIFGGGMTGLDGVNGGNCALAGMQNQTGSLMVWSNTTTMPCMNFIGCKVASVMNVGFQNNATNTSQNYIVYCTNSDCGQEVDFDHVSFQGSQYQVGQFAGGGWNFHKCNFLYSTGSSAHALFIANYINSDCGDHSISDCNFLTETYLVSSFYNAIYCQSSGGVKMSNVKINNYPDGIVMIPTGGNTSDFQLSNVSIENCNYGIIAQPGDGSIWDNWTLAGIQLLMNASGSSSGITMTGGIGNHSTILGVVARGVTTGNYAIYLNGMTSVHANGIIVTGNGSAFSAVSCSDCPTPTF